MTCGGCPQGGLVPPPPPPRATPAEEGLEAALAALDRAADDAFGPPPAPFEGVLGVGDACVMDCRVEVH